MIHPRASHVEQPGVVSVKGPNAETFLQSLVSQDVASMPVGAAVPSLLLQPNGKLLAMFRVVRVEPDEFLLDTDPALAAGLAAGLNRFKIRVKVEIEDRTGQYVAVRVRGGDEPPEDLLVGVSDHLPDVDAVAVDDETWERYRILRREPKQPGDVDDTTIAQEAFLDATHVSFTKGCFVGQELVCRIDSRGHVNRYLRLVRADEEIAPSDELELDGRAVGVITSVARDDQGYVGLATVRREVEPGARLRAGEHDVEVVA